MEHCEYVGWVLTYFGLICPSGNLSQTRVAILFLISQDEEVDKESRIWIPCHCLEAALLLILIFMAAQIAQTYFEDNGIMKYQTKELKHRRIDRRLTVDIKARS